MKLRSRFQPEAVGSYRRLLCSLAAPTHSVEESSMKSTITKKSIKSEILRSKSPTRSPIAVLQDWIKSGHKVTISELRFISLQLQKSKRYHHALEVPISVSLVFYYPCVTLLLRRYVYCGNVSEIIVNIRLVEILVSYVARTL